jgi:hypothetical protein
MKTVLLVGVLVVALFFATLAAVRIAVGFIRWARKNRGLVAEGLFVAYCRESLGEWVDDVAESPGWFPFEGHGGDSTHHHDADSGTSHGSSHAGDSIGGD